jgi:hypothetical protein
MKRSVVAFLFLSTGGLASGLQIDVQSPVPGPFLSPDDKANLAEVLRVKADLGEELWPEFGRADIPIIVYNERFEFLIGEQKPPSPWILVEGDTFGGKLYHRCPSSSPQAFAVRVGNRWAGSMTSLASMKGTPMRIVRESYVLFVHHEMFHAYQASRAAERFRQAEKAYAAEAGYPAKKPGFVEAWDKEGSLLAAALETTNDAARREAVRAFLQARDARRAEAVLTPDQVTFERDLEWLEGLGKYIEIRLCDLARARTADPAYTPYRERLAYFGQSDRFLLAKRLGYQGGDLRFYLSGMAQARLLDELDPEWKQKIMRNGVYLEDLLREALPPDHPGETP